MSQVHQQTKHALGTDCLLTLVTADHAAAKQLFDQLWTDIDRFESRFSRFHVTSELSHVNRRAGENTPVSSEFREVTVRAIEAARQTGGLFNPFVLPALQAAGYLASWPYTEAAIDPSLNVTARRLATVGEIRLSDAAIQIPIDSALEFGGIGKGLMLDRLAAVADAQLPPHGPVTGYWFSLGGDITAAGLDPAGRPWQIAVAGAPGRSVMARPPRRLSVATSGVTGRQGSHHGRPWHHLIDPRTGRPAATDIRTATVVAPTATEADVLASCAVIVGSARALEFLRTHGAIFALIQANDGAVTGGDL